MLAGLVYALCCAGRQGNLGEGYGAYKEWNEFGAVARNKNSTDMTLLRTSDIHIADMSKERCDTRQVAHAFTREVNL